MDLTKIKSNADVSNISRVKKTQSEIDKITKADKKVKLVDDEGKKMSKNLSFHDLSGMKFEPKEYHGKNYSFCNFDKTDLRGCTFDACNFSFSRNIDKAKVDEDTLFITCNFSGADIPPEEVETKEVDEEGEKIKKPLMVKKCNCRQRTDEQIEELFKLDGDA